MTELGHHVKVKVSIVALTTGSDKVEGTSPFAYMALTIFCGEQRKDSYPKCRPKQGILVYSSVKGLVYLCNHLHFTGEVIH